MGTRFLYIKRLHVKNQNRVRMVKKKLHFLFAFVIIFVAKISNVKYNINERSVFERGDRK